MGQMRVNNMNSQVDFSPVTDNTVLLTVLGDQPYPVYELNNILRYIKEKGAHHEAEILKTAQLTFADLNDHYIPAYKMQAVFEYCAKSLGPCAAVELGKTYKISDLGVFGYALASCRNLADAIELSDKYNALTGNLLEKSSHIEGQRYVSRFHNVQNLPKETLSFFITLSLSANLNVARQIFGPALNYDKIFLTYDDEPNRALYEEMFGCDVQFNADFDGWGIDLNLLTLPKQKETPNSFSAFIPYCNELMESMKQKESLVNEIQHILISCSGDYPDIEMLAGAFNVSSRTLRRQLANLGTSYQKILNKVRCQLAIEYLTKTDLSIEDISNLLGFSDVTNFRHAFKKWVDKTPSYYRKINTQ